jgi:hypothetical protein
VLSVLYGDAATLSSPRVRFFVGIASGHSYELRPDSANGFRTDLARFDRIRVRAAGRWSGADSVLIVSRIDSIAGARQ